MAENPYADTVVNTNPYADSPDDNATKSEIAAGSLNYIPMGPHNDPRGAVSTMLTAGSGIAGTIAGGYAGMAGTVAGMVPGGETPSEKGNKWLENTRDAITIPPNQTAQRVLTGVGRAITAPASVAGSALENVSPMQQEEMGSRREAEAGAYRPDPEAIRGSYERIQQEGPSRAAGNRVLDKTGSPELATLAEVTPAVIGGAYSLKRPGVPEVPPGKPPIMPSVSSRSAASVGSPSMDSPVDFTPVSADSVIQSLRKGNVDKVADAVYPDLATIESAQRLDVVLNPEHYSTNTAFQDVARAIKSRPGSELQKIEVAALAKLDGESKKLVTDLDGRIDRAEFSDDVYMETRAKIDELDQRAKAGYKKVDDAIPDATLVDPTSIDAFLKQRLEGLGGRVDMLNPIEKKLYKLIHQEGKIVPPTYMALDRIRKEIGMGYKRQGEFKELGDASLTEGYGLLSDVQGRVAHAFPDGIGDVYDASRGLVSTRKALEQSAVAMFGKDMAGSLVPKIRTAANNLVGGDTSHFKKLMNALPEHLRAKAAANVLGEILAGGTKKGADVGGAFAASWKSLNNKPTAKNLLFSYLTKESRQRFDDIGRVTNSIIQSTRKSLSNPSGSSGPIIAALNDLSAVEKLYDGGKKVLAAEGVSSTLGVPGIGSAAVVGGLLSKTRSPMIVAVDELLTSPQFSAAMNKAIAGDVAAANKIVEGSSAYNKWIPTLSSQERANLAKVGFIAWLTEDENK